MMDDNNLEELRQFYEKQYQTKDSTAEVVVVDNFKYVRENHIVQVEFGEVPIPVPITGSVRSVLIVILSLVLVVCGTLIFYDGYRKKQLSE